MKQLMIGRNNESEKLRDFLSTKKSEFIVVYGRRRVGKTFFIREIIGDDACFSLTGMENADMNDQLSNFYYTLRRYYTNAVQPKSWIEAFDLLKTYLESLSDGRKIVFIDELPWLDTVRSKFVSALELFWNSWASGRDDIKLIVCGSSTSWMIDNIINNRGGLHNRKTHQIYLAPFTLGESMQYFKKYGYGYREKDVAECYMVMGGVAYYYSLMSPELSVSQNIDSLFFSENGELKNEFDNLYRSLFKKAGDHITIVTALSNKNKGLTRKQILQQTKLNNNKKFTTTLSELEKCGFIRDYTPFNGGKRDLVYQLTDAFTLFYFRFMSGNKYNDESYWSHSFNSSKYNSWSGYAFEMLCMNHIRQIKDALGISGVQSNACSWIGKNNDEGKGAQIDLVIDRADQTVNICEMKFSRTEYVISKADYDDFENKVESFISQTKTRKSLMFTLITSYGLKPNKYSGYVHKQITLKDLCGK